MAILGLILMFTFSGLKAQVALTLERALEYAETGSPDIKTSLLNLTRYQKNLEAQRAALKSRFSLDVTPVSFNRSRRFDSRVSEWYTNENLESNTLFRVSQPILITDGTISLNNEFGWQSSISDATIKTRLSDTVLPWGLDSTLRKSCLISRIPIRRMNRRYTRIRKFCSARMNGRITT